MGSNPIPDIFSNSDTTTTSNIDIFNINNVLNSKNKITQNGIILLKSIYFKNKLKFKSWLENKYSKNYIVNVISGVEKIFNYEVKSICEVKALFTNNKVPAKTCSVGFRVLLNYVEEYNLFNDDLIEKYRKKIKIIRTKPNLNIIVPNRDQIKNSIEVLVKSSNEDYLIYYILMLESGIRATELVNFLLNFDEKNLEITKNGICLYKNFYLRGLKSSFYIFFTIKTYERLKKYLINPDEKRIMNFCKFTFRQTEIINLKYLRKYQFNLLIENNVSFEIANFIQGRASQNIGFNHYLSKRNISVKEYFKIINQLNELFI